jgi:endoglucanase
MLPVCKSCRDRFADGVLRMAICGAAVGFSVGCALSASVAATAMASSGSPNVRTGSVHAVQRSIAPGVAGSQIAPPSLPRTDNPLGLPVVPAGGNPLSGARFFVDHENAPSLAARQYPQLRVIADQPGTARFGRFSGPVVGAAVHNYLMRASVQEPGTVPMLATYRVVDGHCGSWSDPPVDQASYHRFITSFARGIGGSRAVLFLEMDAMITTPCLSPHGVAVRMAELRDAINILNAKCPHLVIYLDAGAADALPAGRTAALLRRAGVQQIQGFFLNSTHFDGTSKEIAYGEAVSRMTGDKHFVVNTGENGRGPLVPPDRVHQGNEVLCNPTGRGLGPKPTTTTGYPNVDAFAWTSNPGESGGACVPGAPPTGVFWPAYALMLVRNANFAAGSASSSATNRSRRAQSSQKKKQRHLTTRHRVHRHHRRARTGLQSNPHSSRL